MELGRLFPIRTPLAIYRVPFECPIKLGLDFDQGGTNSVMTHVLVLGVQVRRNERLW